jgi:hypothetical protein
VFIDTSASGFIRSLRAAVGLPPEFEQVIERARKAGFREPECMLGMIRGRNFSGGVGKAMLSHMKTMFDNGYVAVHPSFTDMLIAYVLLMQNKIHLTSSVHLTMIFGTLPHLASTGRDCKQQNLLPDSNNNNFSY